SWQRASRVIGVRRIRSVCATILLLATLPGCLLETQMAGVAPDPVDAVRNADTRARLPARSRSDPDTPVRQPASRPLLFPGAEPEGAVPGRSASDATPQASGDRYAAAESGATVRGAGVEINFENADIQTVARSLLGDILELNFVVDPRVQGTVTLASVGPIPR